MTQRHSHSHSTRVAPALAALLAISVLGVSSTASAEDTEPNWSVDRTAGDGDKLRAVDPNKAPKAEERLVVELLPDPNAGGGGEANALLRVDGRIAKPDDRAFIERAVAELKARLPEAHAKQPAGVLLRSIGAPYAAVAPVVKLMRAAGLKRVHLKDEFEAVVRFNDKKKPSR